MRDGHPTSIAVNRRLGTGDMFGPVVAVGHAIVPSLAGLFTLIVLVLGQSTLWPDSVPVSAKALLVAVGVLSFARPGDGLLLVAGLVPFGQVGARWFGSNARGSEALVLACLSGLFLRKLWSARLRTSPSNGIEWSALLFGLIVAASCIEQLWFLQVQIDFPWPFAQELAATAIGDYLVTFRRFGTLFNAMLLLEGLGLLVCTAHICRIDSTFTTRLVRVLVVGAVAVAAFNLAFAWGRFLESGRPIAGLWQFIARDRWTVHTGDPNAAASYFAMTFVMAVGAGLSWRRWSSPVWLCAASIIAAALWMTGSRTAILAVLMVAVVACASFVLRRQTNRRRALLVICVLIVPVSVLAFQYVMESRSGAALAANIRWMFLQTTVRMLAWQPLFGVGIGQYPLWSQHFSPPELRAIYRTENAHNNFLQVAGELGGIGLVAFLALLASAVWYWKPAQAANPLARSVLAGVGAFVMTWFGGHPLLVPMVAYPFWIALGAVGTPAVPIGRDRSERFEEIPSETDVASRPRIGTRPAVAATFTVVLLIISMPFRLDSKLEAFDWSRIAYGLYGWEVGPSGERFRWTRSRVRFFVPDDASSLGVPLRRISVTETPVTVDLFVAGRPVHQVRLSDNAWATVDIDLSGPTARGHRLVDLRVDRTWIPAEEIPGSTDSRQLGVQVGELVVHRPETTPASP
jgi:hypothetical protein